MAQKIRDWDKLAKDIIKEVGGEDNIANAIHCTTRVRLTLKENVEGAHEKVAALPGVITVVERGGQFQIVVGNHSVDVFDAMSKELRLDERGGGGGRSTARKFAEPRVFHLVLFHNAHRLRACRGEFYSRRVDYNHRDKSWLCEHRHLRNL